MENTNFPKVGTIVSPSRVSKRQKYELKKFKEVKERNLMTNNPEFYVETMKGGFLQLVWCDQQGKEGFIHPFLDKLFDKAPRHLNEYARIKQVTNVIAQVPRRFSKAINEPQMKDGKDNNRYKKSYLVRYSPSGFSYESDMNALGLIADVSMM